MDGLENYLKNTNARPVRISVVKPENGLFAGKNCSFVEFTVKEDYFSNGNGNEEMAEEIAGMFSADTSIKHLGQKVNSDLYLINSIFGLELGAVRFIGHPFTRDLLAKDVKFYNGGVSVRVFTPNPYVAQSIYKEIQDRLNGK